MKHRAQRKAPRLDYSVALWHGIGKKILLQNISKYLEKKVLYNVETIFILSYK